MPAEARWILAVVAAVAAQHLLSSHSATGIASLFSDSATGIASFSAALLAEAPPASPPVRMEAARNEHEIAAQQQHSASQFQRLADDKPLGGVETEAPQPDEVRAAAEAVEAEAARRRALKCGQKVPPESLTVTRGVSIFVKSKYHGEAGSGHAWSYRVEFTNEGVDTVQMLSRHWIFTDATGFVSEMKGPGARGVTPVLRPGDSWSYDSGTQLETSHGAMHGSFQFETLRAVSGVVPSMFNARVGRLALSPTDSLEQAPCGEPARGDMLPDTSVRATRRVIVGATVERQPERSDEVAGVYRWAYDVQINNARDQAITVVAHRWMTVDADGAVKEINGLGVGGKYRAKEIELPAGDAFRTKGILATATPVGNAWGAYTVRAQTAGGDEVEIDAEVGVVGLSTDGTPVADLRPEAG